MQAGILTTASREAFRDAVIEGYADNDRHRIGLRAGLNTALWFWGDKDNQHHIHLGLDIPESRIDNPAYAAAFTRHEMAHARFTTRNLAAVRDWCVANGISMRLLNIFEDGRIEHLWREVSGERFNWTQHEALVPFDHPLMVFLSIIQADGDREPRYSDAPDGEEIRDFYERAIAMETTESLYPLLLEWKARFGDADEAPPSSGDSESDEVQGEPGGDDEQGGGNGDSGDGEDADAQGGAASNAESESEGSKGESGEDEGEGEGEGESKGGSPESAEGRHAKRNTKPRLKDAIPEGTDSRTSDLEMVLNLVESGVDMAVSDANLVAGDDVKVADSMDEGDGSFGDLDSVRLEDLGGCALHPWGYSDPEITTNAAALAKRLRLPTPSPAQPRTSMSPSRRLSARNVARDANEIYKHKAEEKRESKVELNVYVDLSGSMSGGPIKGAHQIIAALSLMAKQGRIKGSMIAHKGGCCTRIALPVSSEELARCVANGGSEGIAHALKRTWSDAQKADVNLFLTDGQITDQPLDVEKMRRQRIFTIGAYVGELDDSRQSHMSKWFTHTLTRKTVEDLCDEISRVMRKARKGKKR